MHCVIICIMEDINDLKSIALFMRFELDSSFKQAISKELCIYNTIPGDWTNLRDRNTKIDCN